MTDLSDMVAPIGGYPAIETASGRCYHSGAVALSTARNCIEYLLRARRYESVYLPHYCCEALVEPFRRLGVKVRYYHLNSVLEPDSFPKLNGNEAFLYVNYFGVKTSCVRTVAARYSGRAIIDNSQAFFAPPVLACDCFYSARKFFGVADGAYLYTDTLLGDDFPQDVSYNRMAHLLKRADIGPEAGYDDFRDNERALCNRPIMRMSRLTAALLGSVDYDNVKRCRRENFDYLHAALAGFNRLDVPFDEADTPMAYPFLCDDKSLRTKLIDQKIFVPYYWRFCDPIDTQNVVEQSLRENLCALPVSQEYTPDKLRRMISFIIQYINIK